MGAQAFNFPFKFPHNMGSKSQLLHFLDDNFPTRRRFSDNFPRAKNSEGGNCLAAPLVMMSLCVCPIVCLSVCVCLSICFSVYLYVVCFGEFLNVGLEATMYSLLCQG